MPQGIEGHSEEAIGTTAKPSESTLKVLVDDTVESESLDMHLVPLRSTSRDFVE